MFSFSFFPVFSSFVVFLALCLCCANKLILLSSRALLGSKMRRRGQGTIAAPPGGIEANRDVDHNAVSSADSDSSDAAAQPATGKVAQDVKVDHDTEVTENAGVTDVVDLTVRAS